VLEFMGAQLNPFGSWGALAYTQHGNLPLMQFKRGLPKAKAAMVESMHKAA
jgi:hypothetical protein